MIWIWKCPKRLGPIKMFSDDCIVSIDRTIGRWGLLGESRLGIGNSVCPWRVYLEPGPLLSLFLFHLLWGELLCSPVMFPTMIFCSSCMAQNKMEHSNWWFEWKWPPKVHGEWPCWKKYVTEGGLLDSQCSSQARCLSSCCCLSILSGYRTPSYLSSTRSTCVLSCLLPCW